jgi:hypothetical protein
MATVEVVPNKSGKWYWQSDSDKSKMFDSRGEAIQDAYQNRDPSEAVVLLRADGKIHGELYHAQTGGSARRVDVEPAGEKGNA